MGVLKTLTINGTTYEVTPVVPASSVTLLANAWVGSGTSYSQVVQVPGATPYTKVDLQPTSEQLEEFHYKILAFVAENNNGVITVYCIGDKPTGDYTIQITKTEVEGTSPIRGNTVGTTMPKPDWNQTDSAKADYIYNKPYVPAFDDTKVGTNVWTSQKVADEIMRLDRSPGIVCEASGDVIAVNDASNQQLAGLNIYGKTTQNGTPTPEAPIPLESVGESIGVTVTGKNLFGGDAFADKWVAEAKATKDETAETVYVNAQNAKGTTIFTAFKENTQYTIILKAEVTATGPTCIELRYTDGTYKAFQPSAANVAETMVFTTPAGKSLQKIVGVYTAHTRFYYNECGIFEGVLTEADFEPYKDAQTLTVSTPNGLHSVGEVKDEIDFARGVRVQRIGEVDMGTLDCEYHGTHKQFAYVIPLKAFGKNNFLCTSYVVEELNGYSTKLSDGGMCGHEASSKVYVRNSAYTEATAFKTAMSGVTLLYELATPIETPLSAEELAKYAALHSNKPNTTVFNDAGADMALAYNADTKLYIDNKFNELALAILNNA